jgi:hypothetical protein
MALYLLPFVFFELVEAGQGTPEPVRYFVATDGNDAWSGRRPAPNADRSDGPFASPSRARDAIRALKRESGGALNAPVIVAIRGGRYQLAEPLVLKPEDSGTERFPITYTAFQEERPVLSGGRAIGGWAEGKIGGKPCWVADVPQAKDGKWWFHQLFIGGQRRPRARHPNAGQESLGIESVPGIDAKTEIFTGQDSFRYAAGDLHPWETPEDVDIVVLHYWIAEHMAVRALDGSQRLVKFLQPTRMRLTEGHGSGPSRVRYYVENARELLDATGEWYLDRKAGRLFYLPESGESIAGAETIAPFLTQLLRLEGRPEAGQFVEHVNFHGLGFAHSEWWPARNNPVAKQSAVTVPGALWGEGVRHSRFEACTVAHVGNYAIELGRGCTHNVIARCHLHDLAAGGVKLGEPAIRPEGPLRASANVIEDCHIHDGGQAFHQAVGVWIGQSPDNRVAHNHIHDLDYTGISVGWTWGYGPAIATGNVVRKNHVHHVGRGRLSDLGGIYTLGLQRGTVVENNVFHDIAAYNYGGWGIYFDEGTTEILATGNLVYRTTHGGLHQHYGRDNIVSHNIFAFGRDAQIRRGGVEPHRSFALEHNIVYWERGPLMASDGDWSQLKADFDHNLYWRTQEPATIDFAGMSWNQWRSRGADSNSRIADPRFVAPTRADFSLAPDSPARELGFKPLAIADVGPRAATAN